MQNCKDDYQAVYQPHAILHAMKENVISRMLRDVVRHMRPRGIPLAMTMKNDGHAFMSMEASPAGLTASGVPL